MASLRQFVPQEKIYYPLIDVLWLISAMFIIWFHTPPRFAPATDNIVWYIGVSLFFFISGCLFHADNVPLKSFMRKIFKRLVWPALVCYLFFYLLWLFFGRYHAGIEDLSARWYDPLIQLILGEPSLVCSTLWFIVAMVVIQGVSWLFINRCSLPLLLALSVVLAIIAPFIKCKVLNVNFVSVFMIWHTLGICFQKINQKYMLLKPGERKNCLMRIKQVGVLILAFQNYVIGCLKMLFGHFSVDLMAASWYMKYVVAILAIIITIVSALVVDRLFSFITDVSLLKRDRKG